MSQTEYLEISKFKEVIVTDSNNELQVTRIGGEPTDRITECASEIRSNR